eukprot:scaffold1075_cov246-Chaetoceros_neogracile.AAC.5
MGNSKESSALDELLLQEVIIQQHHEGEEEGNSSCHDTAPSTSTSTVIARTAPSITTAALFSHDQIELLPDTQIVHEKADLIEQGGELRNHTSVFSHDESKEEREHQLEHHHHHHQDSIAMPSIQARQHIHELLNRNDKDEARVLEFESPSIPLLVDQCTRKCAESKVIHYRHQRTQTQKQKQKQKQNQTRDQGTQTMRIGTRIRMEQSKPYHYFSLQEDLDCTILHIQQTFAPYCSRIFNLKIPLPLFYRLLCCYATHIILRYDHHDAMLHQKMCNIMYFGHLTNMTLVLALFYQCLSTMLSVIALFHPGHSWFMPRFRTKGAPKGKESHYDVDDNDDDITTNNGCTPSWILQLTWLLYSIVLPAEFLVAIGYWSFEYNPSLPMAWINLYKHGIIGVLLLWDGNVVGRIPIRIKHCRGLFIYGISYLLWSVLFSYLKLGKRHGVIYGFMDWRKDPELAAAIAFLMLFVIGPLVFMVCWWVSVSDGCCSCFFCGCGGYGGRRRRVLSADGINKEEWFRGIDDAFDDEEKGSDVWSANRHSCDFNYGSLDQQETDSTLSTNVY